MPPASGMATPVAAHPDMLLFAGFGSLFVRAAHMADENFAQAIYRILSRRPNIRLVETDDIPADKYPADVCFNCFILGTSLICLADAVSAAIKTAASEAGVPLESMAQGYAKCSCAVINAPSGDAVISSDPSVIALAERLRMPSLKITPGNISLPGYDSGFIGGASFTVMVCFIFSATIIVILTATPLMFFAAHSVSEPSHCRMIFSLTPAVFAFKVNLLIE